MWKVVLVGKLNRDRNRKYDESCLSFGFSWTWNVDNPQTVCLVYGIKMSSESMLPSKLGRHLKIKHSHLQDKPTSYYKRMSEQQGKAADSFKSLKTASHKVQMLLTKSQN